MAANIGVALAHGAARPFFRVEETAERKGKLKEQAKPDPHLALELTKPALATLRQDKAKALNLAYGRVVRRRAEYHRALGEDAQARRELEALAKDLAERGANPNVVQSYQALASDEPDPKSPKRSRTAARTRKLDAA